MAMRSELRKERVEEVDDRARGMRHAEKVDGETGGGYQGKD